MMALEDKFDITLDEEGEQPLQLLGLQHPCMKQAMQKRKMLCCHDLQKP